MRHNSQVTDQSNWCILVLQTKVGKVWSKDWKKWAKNENVIFIYWILHAIKDYHGVMQEAVECGSIIALCNLEGNLNRMVKISQSPYH